MSILNMEIKIWDYQFCLDIPIPIAISQTNPTNFHWNYPTSLAGMRLVVPRVVETAVVGKLAADMSAAGIFVVAVSALGILDYVELVLFHDLVDPMNGNDDVPMDQGDRGDDWCWTLLAGRDYYCVHDAAALQEQQVVWS
jgi:hypothetical protein